MRRLNELVTDHSRLTLTTIVMVLMALMLSCYGALGGDDDPADAGGDVSSTEGEAGSEGEAGGGAEGGSGGSGGSGGAAGGDPFDSGIGDGASGTGGAGGSGGDPFDSGTGDGGGENCGNGVIDPGEQCDGRDLGGASCASLGFGQGRLQCSAVCTYDASMCFGTDGGGYGDGGRALRRAAL